MKKTAVKYLEPGGIIWKVLPDEHNNYLVIESRDSVLRKTLLSVLSLEEEEFLYKGIFAPKPWWIGLKATAFGKIIFQGYKESQTPEPKGIYVLDSTTGKESWKAEEKVFHSFVEKDSVILSAREGDQIVLHKTSLISGEIIQQLKEEEYREAPLPEIGSVFPLLYLEDNSHYKTITSFLEQNNYKVVGPVEYLEYETKVLVSFYIQEGKKLINVLWMVDEEGETLLEDKLTEGSEGVGMSSFFIWNKKLIYIKNKTNIALAKLS